MIAAISSCEKTTGWEAVGFDACWYRVLFHEMTLFVLKDLGPSLEQETRHNDTLSEDGHFLSILQGSLSIRKLQK